MLPIPFLVTLLVVRVLTRTILTRITCSLKEIPKVLIDSEARLHGVEGGVGLDLGGVDVQLLAPHEARVDALLNDGIEEPAKDLEPVALPDACERRMVGQGLIESVSHIPADAEAISSQAHELSLRAQSLQVQNELELEEDHRVDGGPPVWGVAVLHPVADEGQIEFTLEVTVEVVWGNELVK